MKKQELGFKGKKEENITNTLFYRSFEIERSELDTDKREIELSFSSQTQVMRWFGAEILLHGDKNVDLSRLSAFGSLLYAHNPYDIKDIIGPVKRCWTDKKKKKCRALVGFDEDEDGERAMGKVKSGSLRGVSCGYNIIKAHMIYEGEEWTDEDSGETFKGPSLIGVRWEPVEVSLTPVPADTSVGIGRAMMRSLDGIDIIEHKHLNEEDKRMDEKQVMELVGKKVREIVDELKIPTVDEIVTKVRQLIKEDGKPKLNITVEQLQDLTARAAAVSDELYKEVNNAALEGKTEPELLRMINDAIMKQPDAKDSVGNDKGNGKGKIETAYRDLSEMPDDVFIHSLK